MTNPCSIDGCDRSAKVKGKCQRCYFRAWSAKRKAEKSGKADPMTVRIEAKKRLILSYQNGSSIDDLCLIINHEAAPWAVHLMYYWVFGQRIPNKLDADKIIRRIDENGQLLPSP